MLAAWPCTASCFRIAVIVVILLILVVVLVLLLLVLPLVVVLAVAIVLVVERLGRRLCACSIVAVMVFAVLPFLLPRVPD